MCGELDQVQKDAFLCRQESGQDQEAMEVEAMRVMEGWQVRNEVMQGNLGPCCPTMRSDIMSNWDKEGKVRAVKKSDQVCKGMLVH